MSVIGSPQITELPPDIEDYTCVTFEPDLKKFKMRNIDDDTFGLLCKRVYDLAGCTKAGVKVYLNKK